MRVFSQAVALVITLLFDNSLIHAQITNDPSGHWEGTITMPMGEIRFEIDLARDGKGQLSGTIGIPEQKLRGLPLTSVSLDGSAVTFTIRGGQGGTFSARLSTDARTMSGKASSAEGEAPFDLTRTGDARIAAAPRNAPIGKDLEGTWNGTLDVRGGMRVIVRIANQSDGTSSASMVSVDEGNLEIAMALVQEGSAVRLHSPILGSSYVGTLNASGNELAGNYTTSQGMTLPLTLKKQ